MATFAGLSCLVLAVLAQSSTTWAQWCSISSCTTPSQHTMCLYPTSATASACGTVSVNSVSATDQQEILRVHNQLRSDVKNGNYRQHGLPPAKSIPPLVWNDELATIAQRWANQCVKGHDKCRNRLNGGYVGQNFAWAGGYPKDWEVRIKDRWFTSELKYVASTLNGLKYRGGRAGHLTQIIWAGTTEIGCGYVEMQGARYVERFYFCNYGPGGNYYNQNVYEPQ